MSDASPRREPGDLAEARLFAFLRGPIWYGACQHPSSHESRDTDPLQHVAVQHRILIPLSFLIVLPVVSSAAFLSVGPSLIAVGFGSSFQLLSRGISFRPNGGGKAAVGRGRRTEKDGEEAGK